MPLLGSILLASLLGSPHCAGMCGGFVAFYSGGAGRGRALPHVAYNGGRLVSYLLLGALAGALGAGLDHVAAVAGVGRVAAVVAGAAMVAWGAATLLTEAGVVLRLPVAPLAIRRALTASLRAVHAQPAPVRGLVMGLITTLLPCGWLYAFVTVAGGTARPLAGAIVMLAFWLGTLPVMAGLGVAAQAALGPLRRRVPLLTATLLVVFGLLTVAGKFRPMTAMPQAMPGMAEVAQHPLELKHDHR